MKKKRFIAAALAFWMAAGGAATAAEAQVLRLPKAYNGVGPYHDGLASVNLKTGPDDYLMGYIDRQGKEVVPCKYLRTDNFAEGLGRVFTGDAFDHRYGYIDTSGKVVLPLTSYGDSGVFTLGGDGEFHGGVAVINTKNYGEKIVADRNGKLYFATDMTGRAKVSGQDLSGELFDKVGYPAYATEGLGGGYFTYRIHEYFSQAENRFLRMQSIPFYQENWGDWRTPVFYGDTKGHLWFYHTDPQPFYATGSRVIDGKVLVQDAAGKCGVATLDEQLVIPVEYDAIYWEGMTAHNTLFAACKDGVWMGIDEHGENHMPFLADYDNVQQVMISPEGYVLVKQYTETEYTYRVTALDYNGNVIIPSWLGDCSARGPFIGRQDRTAGGDTTLFYGRTGNLLTMGDGWKYVWDWAHSEREAWEMGLMGFYNDQTKQVTYLDAYGAVVIPPVKYKPYDAYSLGASVGYASEGRIGFNDENGKRAYIVVPGWTDQNAVPSACKVTVDGVETPLAAYEIGGSSFFKLRDLAMVLKDTPAAFQVEWDARGPLYLTTNTPYVPVGGELSGAGSAQKAALSSSSIYCNGDHTNTLGYTIGGSNYYKLRDIAKLLNVNVTFDAAENVISIDTATRYAA